MPFLSQVSFEVNVITPFSGVRLQIGGAVETYWKSIANPVSNPPPKHLTPRSMHSARPITSAQNSPSAHPMTPVGSHSLTHSSVTGSYLHITVQVTRDRHPVVFPRWLLPEDGYELGVADVTLAQFRALACRLGRGLHPIDPQASSQVLYEMVSQSMASLADALRVCRISFEIKHGDFLTCPSFVFV